MQLYPTYENAPPSYGSRLRTGIRGCHVQAAKKRCMHGILCFYGARSPYRKGKSGKPLEFAHSLFIIPEPSDSVAATGRKFLNTSWSRTAWVPTNERSLRVC